MNLDEDPNTVFTPRKSLERSPVRSSILSYPPPVDLTVWRPEIKTVSKEVKQTQDMQQTKTRQSSKLTSQALDTLIEDSGSEKGDDSEDLESEMDLN